MRKVDLPRRSLRRGRVLPLVAAALAFSLGASVAAVAEVAGEEGLSGAADLGGDDAGRDGRGDGGGQEGKDEVEVEVDGEGEGEGGDGEGGRRGGISWSLLPIVGYNPETSLSVGLKFEESDLFGLGAILDAAGTYSLNTLQSYSASLEDPHLFGSRFTLALEGAYDLNPSKKFFGLGNNEIGPDPSANYEFTRILGRASLGVWLTQTLHYDFSVGYYRTTIGPGKSEKSPDLAAAYPGLIGLEGGDIFSFRATLLYTGRGKGYRPVSGWRIVGSVEEVRKDILNIPTFGADFDYTFYRADASRLFNLYHGAHVIGLRAFVQYIEGRSAEIPFFSFVKLGGGDSLRGFFPERFLGRASAAATAEYRLKLVDFNFFDIWYVYVDSVAFFEAGRVYDDKDEIKTAVFRHWRQSYGGGIRFSLSSGLVARVDAGFSSESTGLIFLGFGHMF